MKRIGIIGGMGVQATIDLYQKIVAATKATSDQEHIPVLIDSYPQIEDRTAWILGKGADPTRKLVESALRLQGGGVAALILACNTAHYFAPAIRSAVAVPLLHIADASLAVVQEQVPKTAKIALLATDGTHSAGIYERPLQEAGYALEALGKIEQDTIMTAIYHGAKAGHIAEYAPSVQRVIDSLDADALLLACTELPLFLPYLNTDKLLIDSTAALAFAAVRFSGAVD